MTHLPPLPPSTQSLALISFAVITFLGYARRIVKAACDFIVFVFHEIQRLVRECRKVSETVQNGHNNYDRPRIRAPRRQQRPKRRIIPATPKGGARTRTSR